MLNTLVVGLLTFGTLSLIYLSIPILFAVMIRGLGAMICRLFKREVGSDTAVVGVVGFAFWILVGVALWAFSRAT